MLLTYSRCRDYRMGESVNLLKSISHGIQGTFIGSVVSSLITFQYSAGSHQWDVTLRDLRNYLYVSLPGNGTALC